VAKKYTVLLIPDGHGPTRQIQFSLRSKRLLAVGALALAGTFLGLAAHDVFQARYINQHQEEFAQLDKLKTQLEEKDREIAHLNDQTAKMTENLEGISALEKQIASILKIQPPGTAPSRGEANIAPQSYIPSTQAELNADIVASHLELLQEYYVAALQHEKELNHTPTILPADGEIASPFGYRKNPFGAWSREFHNGIDIACDYGTPVKATADGTVIFAGWDRVYGRKIEIDHGNGIVTFYGHNSRLTVKNGDQVKKGEIIAYSGNSGRSTGAHLHYGAIINGQSTDPLVFTNFTKEQ